MKEKKQHIEVQNILDERKSIQEIKKREKEMKRLKIIGKIDSRSG
jgi:hypothetical protein